MTEPIHCLCGGTTERVTEPREITLSHWSVTVEDHFLRCLSCGEQWYLPGEAQATQERAAKLIRESHGLFDPDRIRALRSRYEWSQADLERLLRVGPKTVVRWEKGSVVPGAAANTLLEVLEKNPDIARQLSLERGVSFKQLFWQYGALMTSTWGSSLVSGPKTTWLWYPAAGSTQPLKSVWVSPQSLVSAWVSLKPQKSMWASWVSGPNVAWNDLSLGFACIVEPPRAHSIPDELEALLKAA